MHFVNDLTCELSAAPISVRPAKLARIDDLRRTMRTVGLKTRRRIRIGIFTIQPVSVEDVRSCIKYYTWERAIAFAIEFLRYGPSGRARTLEHPLHRFSAWRPHAEVGTARWLRFRADGQAPDYLWLIFIRKFSSSFGREIVRD